MDKNFHCPWNNAKLVSHSFASHAWQGEVLLVLCSFFLRVCELRWMCNQTKFSQQFTVICTCVAQSLTTNVTFVVPCCCLELSRGRYCWEFFSVWNVILVPLWNYKPSIMSIRRAKHAGSWYTNDGGRTFNHEYFFFRRWTYWYNCSRAGVFKIFCCGFFFPSSKCSTETKREARGVVI